MLVSSHTNTTQLLTRLYGVPVMVIFNSWISISEATSMASFTHDGAFFSVKYPNFGASLPFSPPSNRLQETLPAGF